VAFFSQVDWADVSLVLILCAIRIIGEVLIFEKFIDIKEGARMGPSCFEVSKTLQVRAHLPEDL
jgi:hypothetical protein